MRPDFFEGVVVTIDVFDIKIQGDPPNHKPARLVRMIKIILAERRKAQPPPRGIAELGVETGVKSLCHAARHKPT
jgi:hypothetical protein